MGDDEFEKVLIVGVDKYVGLGGNFLCRGGFKGKDDGEGGPAVWPYGREIVKSRVGVFDRWDGWRIPRKSAVAARRSCGRAGGGHGGRGFRSSPRSSVGVSHTPAAALRERGVRVPSRSGGGVAAHRGGVDVGSVGGGGGWGGGVGRFHQRRVGGDCGGPMHLGGSVGIGAFFHRKGGLGRDAKRNAKSVDEVDDRRRLVTAKS